MVSEIKIQCGKFLALKETITVSLLGNPSETNATVNSSVSKLKACGVFVSGPPIIWAGARIDGDKVILERKLILQCAGDMSRISTGFERKKATKIGPCIHARFIGDEQNLVRAFEKVSVYAYENEIELKKENYTVYVKNDGPVYTIDIFVPLEGGG